MRVLYLCIKGENKISQPQQGEAHVPHTFSFAKPLRVVYRHHGPAQAYGAGISPELVSAHSKVLG